MTANQKQQLALLGSEEQSIILKRLEEYGEADVTRREALVHALVDIRSSLVRVYGELLPELIRDTIRPPEVLRDQLWELREEFRHIEYHLKDGGWADL